jgi:hypothetical protein
MGKSNIGVCSTHPVQPWIAAADGDKGCVASHLTDRVFAHSNFQLPGCMEQWRAAQCALHVRRLVQAVGCLRSCPPPPSPSAQWIL